MHNCIYGKLLVNLDLSCNQQIQCFLDVCSRINFLVSMEKTVWATTVITFLGFLINAEDHTISIPTEKVQHAMDQIKLILSKKKTTVHAMQKLTGFLNFLCRCIVPGRAFTRRLCTHVSPKMKPHHHLSVNKEIRLDLETWWMFLWHSLIFCRPFIDFSEITHSEILNWFTDSLGKIGCGGVFGHRWKKVWYNKIIHISDQGNFKQPQCTS